VPIISCNSDGSVRALIDTLFHHDLKCEAFSVVVEAKAIPSWEVGIKSDSEIEWTELVRHQVNGELEIYEVKVKLESPVSSYIQIEGGLEVNHLVYGFVTVLVCSPEWCSP